MLRQILFGIDHLHSMKIVHGDLKPSNILVSQPLGRLKPQMKLSDFGLRHVIKEDRHKLIPIENKRFRAAHSKGWMCPTDSEDDPAFDVFSFACVIIVTVCGSHPFGETKEDRVSRISQLQSMLESCEEKLRRFGTSFVALVSRMLAFDAHQRPTVNELLLDGFFASPNAALYPFTSAASSYDQQLGILDTPFRRNESTPRLSPESQISGRKKIVLELESPIPSTSSNKTRQSDKSPMWPAYSLSLGDPETPLLNQSREPPRNCNTPPLSELSISCSPTVQSLCAPMQLDPYLVSSPASSSQLEAYSTSNQNHELPPIDFGSSPSDMTIANTVVRVNKKRPTPVKKVETRYVKIFYPNFHANQYVFMCTEYRKSSLKQPLVREDQIISQKLLPDRVPPAENNALLHPQLRRLKPQVEQHYIILNFHKLNQSFS